MKIYYYNLISHCGQAISTNSTKFGTSKHCAMAAKEELANTPPAKDFKIGYFYVDAKWVANLYNAYDNTTLQ